MRFRIGKLLLALSLPVLLLASLAYRYTTIDLIGLSHGFSHPLQGWDHLLTMLAVGIWAAQMRGHAIWMLPLAFVSVMSLGGFAGAAGITIPSAEGIILLSGAVFGVLITRKIRFSTKINVLIVAFFAFFHGFAHGQEISTSASLISYTAGFMVATLLLHGAGIVVAKLVVVCVASLLTMLLTHASPSSNLETELYGDANISRPSFGSNETAPVLLNHRDLSLQTDMDNGTQPSSQGKLRTRTGYLPNDFNRHAVKLHHGIGKTSLPNADHIPYFCNAVHGLALPQDKHTTEVLTRLHRIDIPLDITAFNCYYPTINNSPGRSFLTNGLGITSPPQFLDSPARLPRFTRNTPIIEASSLQLFSTDFYLTLFQRTIIQIRDAFAGFLVLIALPEPINLIHRLNTRTSRKASLVVIDSLQKSVSKTLLVLGSVMDPISLPFVLYNCLKLSKSPSAITFILSQPNYFLAMSLYHQKRSLYAR
ncbi:MAG: HupE/UreJ family protein [Methylococcaceae bacterium]|nr:HupE/UreJ family protein [Methylococcaceae bacterium]